MAERVYFGFFDNFHLGLLLPSGTESDFKLEMYDEVLPQGNLAFGGGFYCKDGLKGPDGLFVKLAQNVRERGSNVVAIRPFGMNRHDGFWTRFEMTSRAKERLERYMEENPRAEFLFVE